MITAIRKLFADEVARLDAAGDKAWQVGLQHGALLAAGATALTWLLANLGLLMVLLLVLFALPWLGVFGAWPYLSDKSRPRAAALANGVLLLVLAAMFTTTGFLLFVVGQLGWFHVMMNLAMWGLGLWMLGRAPGLPRERDTTHQD